MTNVFRIFGDRNHQSDLSPWRPLLPLASVSEGVGRSGGLKMLAQHLHCRCPFFVSAPRWLQPAKSTCLNPDRVTAQLPTHYTQQGVSSDGLLQLPCPARSPLFPSLQPALTPSPDASLDLIASPIVFTWLPPPPHPFRPLHPPCS